MKSHEVESGNRDDPAESLFLGLSISTESACRPKLGGRDCLHNQNYSLNKTMKKSKKQNSRLVNLLIASTSLIVVTQNGSACSDCVFGPVVYLRGSGGPTVFTPSFVATPG